MLTMSGRPEGVAALRMDAAVAMIAAQLRPPAAKDALEAIKEANRVLDKAADLYAQVSMRKLTTSYSCSAL
jgi:hypothetical protein